MRTNRLLQLILLTTLAAGLPLFVGSSSGKQSPDVKQIPDDYPKPAPQKADPMIQKIVSDISEQHVSDIMKTLGNFETRNISSDPSQTNRGVGAAREWIMAQFKSYSPKLQVSFDPHVITKRSRVYKDVELRNVMAILPGKSPEATNRWILVTGHYDSINIKDSPELARTDPAKSMELTAPGVSDDGSGTACVMECARVLSQYDFDATLVFVAFAGEEEGLLGAHGLAKDLRAKNQQIEAVLNNDIIGNDVAGNGLGDAHRVLVFSEDPDDSASRQLARYIHSTQQMYYPDMLADIIFRYDRFGRGGDHTAFNQEGYPGVRFTTPNENLAQQHSKEDTFEHASPSYATRVIRINAATAASLALAPKSPITSTNSAPAGSPAGTGRRSSLTRGISQYDAVLRWEYPDPEPNLAGFIVVARSTTAPDWEREIWAGEAWPSNRNGDLREFTVKNAPIDQLVFGVKAVDKAGHESPVSAYVNRQPTAREQN